MSERISPITPELTAWNLIDEQSRLLAQMLAGFPEEEVVSLPDLAGGINAAVEAVSQKTDYMLALGIVKKTKKEDQIFCYSLTPTFRGFLARR